MTKFVVKQIDHYGMIPVLAYYEPYSVNPRLSVPCFNLGMRKAGFLKRIEWDNYESYAIGAWLPELEFTHYLPTQIWKEVAESCHYHIVVSGNCLAAAPYYFTKRNFLAWIATPWMDDRKDRVKLLPFPRKVLDRVINGNIIKILERKYLLSGTILALSKYTEANLNAIVTKQVISDVLPMPVDSDHFRPDRGTVVTGKIGFVGRFTDPRKNIYLLLRALKICRDKGVIVSSEIIGGEMDEKMKGFLKDNNLTDIVNVVPFVRRDKLPEYLKTFDLFVVPSHQEGLCIAALEAMACGCPVISTRCGGTEEFVCNGKTGFLVDSEPEAVAKSVMEVLGNHSLRMKLSDGARSVVKENYSQAKAEKIFFNAFNETFMT